jgi:PIN domain nuclease of toxin-antitoxin system
MNEGFLLDTCAAVWIANDKPMSETAGRILNTMFSNGTGVYISAASAWEIGMLITRNRIPTTKTAFAWFSDFLMVGNVSVQPATPRIMIAASYLPEPLHRDPMDRIIIATAREHDLTIVTRDRAILTYGALGHVRVLEC